MTYKARKEPKAVVLAKFDRRYPNVLGYSAMVELPKVKKEESQQEKHEEPVLPDIHEDELDIFLQDAETDPNEILRMNPDWAGILSEEARQYEKP